MLSGVIGRAAPTAGVGGCRMQLGLAVLGKLCGKGSASKREGKIKYKVSLCCRGDGPWAGAAQQALSQILHGYWFASEQTKGGSYLKLEKLKLKKSSSLCLSFAFLHVSVINVSV